MFKDRKKTALIPFIAFVAACVVILGIVSAFPYDRPTTNMSNSFGNAMNGACVAKDGSITYYIDSDGVLRCQGEGDVYRIAEKASCVFPYNYGVVYLSDQNLCYSDFTGSNQKVLDSGVSSCVISGFWAYYSKNGTLYKMRVDDAEPICINLNAKQYAVSGTYTYYIGEDDFLYCSRNDGSNNQRFLSTQMQKFQLFEQNIFYLDFDGALYKTYTSNTAYQQKLLDKCDMFIVNADGLLFYCVDDKLFYWDLTVENSSAKEVSGEFSNITNLNCLNDDFYFYSNSVLTRIKADGSERKEF